MIKKILFAALIGIPFSVLTAQSSCLSSNTIQVAVEGKYEAEPDTAILEFNISVQEQTYKEAHERAYRATQEIAELLKRYKLDPKDAEFSLFQTQPVYDYNNPKRPLVGYRVNSNVSIQFTDFSKLSYILPDLMKTNITDNQSINYVLHNTDQAKMKAVQDGYHRARLLADALAHASGKKVNDMIGASIDIFENKPMFRTLMSKSTNAPGESPSDIFGAQKISVTAHITAAFELGSVLE